jgi:biotin-(acetyl-CoA carboxylase) ligase
MNQSDALVLPKWHADLESALLDFDDFAPLTFAFPAESVLVPPAWLPIAVGCAIVDALRSTAGFLLSSFSDLPSHDVSAEDSMRLKWPNDVVMRVGSGPGGEPRYRKLAGVLCETSVQGGRFSTFLVGVGLNFFRAPDLDGAASFVAGLFASSLGKKSERSRVNRFLADASSRQIVLARFAQNLTKEMHEYVCVRRTSGQLRGLAVERSVPLGTVLSVNKGSVIGGFAGLAENGGLLLEGRQDPILAGDVVLFEGLGSLTGGVNAVRPAEGKGGRTSKGGKEAKDGKDEGTLCVVFPTNLFPCKEKRARRSFLISVIPGFTGKRLMARNAWRRVTPRGKSSTTLRSQGDPLTPCVRRYCRSCHTSGKPCLLRSQPWVT